MERKTPLYDSHVACGGKMVPFAGYLLPVQYQTGVLAEHDAVRTKAGLFDVSHMGELLIFGADALENLQMLLTNDFTNMYDGQCRYTLLCNEAGGIVDDLLVYRMEENRYLLVINAANVEKDEMWIKEHLFGEVEMKNLSSEVAQIALQGPMALTILKTLCAEESLPKKYYSFTKEVDVEGIQALISKTGYTGEDGYELYCQSEDAPMLWNKLLEAGKEFGLMPCGLGARDTLRFEASMPLYGHEMNDEITPFEADLDFAVKMQKRDFIGKEALANKSERKRKRVGLKLISRGIAREECDVFSDNIKIGMTTSGTHCPFLKAAYAMALLDMDYTKPETLVQIEVRGRRLDAEVVSLPFYKREVVKK